VTLLNTVADRLLARIVPKVKAEAAPCVCDPNTSWWGSFCYCSGTRHYRNYCTCASNCQSVSCYCRYAGQSCI
jgi:hypothetical protein